MSKKEMPKIETAEDWEKAKNFIPKKNQIIIYDGIQEAGSYVKPPRVKIGDGVTKVSDLPFETNIDCHYFENTKMLLIN